MASVLCTTVPSGLKVIGPNALPDIFGRAMLTPMCSAATLNPVEQPELGLTKRSLRRRTTTFHRRGDAWQAPGHGSLSANPSPGAVVGPSTGVVAGSSLFFCCPARSDGQ